MAGGLLRRLLVGSSGKQLGGGGAERRARRVLERQLQLAERADASDCLEVQILGQVSPGEDWAQIAAHWRRRDPRRGLAWTPDWPERLRADQLAINLWPVAPGRVGLVAGASGVARKRQPKRIVAPAAALWWEANDPASNPDNALAVVLSHWLGDVIERRLGPVRLAPPVLEVWRRGGVLERREVVDFGLSYPMPRPDGV